MTFSPVISTLAIDGGGSRCRIALTVGAETFTIEVGSVNVSSDFEGALVELQRGLALVAERAGLASDNLAKIPAYLGLAGVTGTEVADRLAIALSFQHMRIEDDRRSALRGALGRADGIVAHCGTGSFAAAQIGGRTSFVGGWGPVLGDEASAQWVGRSALSRVLDTVDGVLEATELTRYLIHRFESSADIVAFAGTATPAQFGAFAVDVTRHAASGDPIAMQILQIAADYIAGIAKSLGWQPGVPICLTGGIAPHYKDYLPSEMRADVIQALGEPLAGAIALAEDFRKEVENERR